MHGETMPQRRPYSGRMIKRAVVVLCIAALLSAAPALAWVNHLQSFAAVRAATPLPADPSLADPEWKTGVTMTDFFNYTTREPAKLATVAYLLYDAKYLYIGVHCEQAGTPITATQTVDNAGVSTDDHVGLNLETSGSGARIYQFRVNPKGIHDEYDSENARYAPEWTSRAEILPDGSWNAVMIVPLSAIRGQKTSVQAWRFSFVRYVAATNASYTWAYEPSMTAVGNSQNWPLLTGLKIAANATKPKPYADAYGLAGAGSDRNVFQNGVGNFERTHPRSVGLDVTVPLTNTLAFVGTQNPDFSNVEQDQTTIAPQEFQRQYTEYRPFFSQGAGYIANLPGININSYQTLFYSPSIGIFDRGLKLEGTTGESSIGALNVIGDGFNDSTFGYNFQKPDGSEVLGLAGVEANHTGVHDDAYGISVGGINPHSGYTNVVSYQTDRGTNVTDSAQGNDLSIGTGLQDAKTMAFLAYKDIGPEFDPIDGYTQINDIRGPQGIYQYNGVGGKSGALQSYQLTVVGDRYVDRSGAAHEADFNASATLTFKNLLGVGYTDTVSELRSYEDAYPFYYGGQTLAYNQQALSLAYKGSSPTPTTFMYMWGPFGGLYTQQMDLASTQVRGPYGLSLEYGSTTVHRIPGITGYLPSGLLAPPIDSQWLRRVSLTRSFGKNASIAIGLRNINGDGGYAQPGTDLALSYHQRFSNANELYVVYGTPAYYQTLHRFLVKYIFHVGGSTGT